MRHIFLLITFLVLTGCVIKKPEEAPKQISGIYPGLAYYNFEGECGTGAVVPWADHLWVISYGPHLPFGSSDKLYEITPGLKSFVRHESIGGTPANRMIHRESNQLFIGPYVIDKDRNVRTIPYESMPGRHTGNARHLSDPEGKIYYATMEEGLYEVDIKTLDIKTLFRDANRMTGGIDNPVMDLLPGTHGKGLYSGQGVLIYTNNGEAGADALEKYDVQSGVLAEWDGNEWKIIRRNQFVEVTGPGGIYGNQYHEKDPVWATGWDHKSLLVGVRNLATGWDFYRLPKASHSYDGAHGWNTEWPRIRNVGSDENPDYLMTMHGMFWRFPATFTSDNSAGIRPRSAYLKVIGDFARWNGRLVFGCDDAANREFLNTRKAKGAIAGPGQSNSNLWFTSIDLPDKLGPATADGSLWSGEEVAANVPSEPFLFEGWDIRSCWIKNDGAHDVSVTFEVDKAGNNKWTVFKRILVKHGESMLVPFGKDDQGEWIRAISDKSTRLTLNFTYSNGDDRLPVTDQMYDGLARVSDDNVKAGLLWGVGDNRRVLGLLAGTADNNSFTETGYYELDSLMNLVKKEDIKTVSYIREKMGIPENVVTIDDASVLVIDDKGRRWRLPKGNQRYDSLTSDGLLRICREVVTERDLFNCYGTFYELPAENADGYAKIRPVASHNLRIHDYSSYRGLCIMTGIQNDLPSDNPHIIRSNDGKAAVWAGVIDDLWKLGKPVGSGGPWKESKVKAGEPSDAYLIGFYDKRSLHLSHDSEKQVVFKIEADPAGNGQWMKYMDFSVEPGENYDYSFPETFQARWIRVIADSDCKAIAFLKYE